MGRAWHGRAVARGRVASGRAESCKSTVLRVWRIVPFARERSHAILVRNIMNHVRPSKLSKGICPRPILKRFRNVNQLRCAGCYDFGFGGHTVMSRTITNNQSHDNQLVR